MAENLMNTQTGGTGETIQLQPDAPQSPEQFDVNIRPQQQEQQIINEAPSSEASNITEQPIPSQTGVPMEEQTTEPTDVPIEPPIAGQFPMTEEEYKSSQGINLLSDSSLTGNPVFPPNLYAGEYVGEYAKRSVIDDLNYMNEKEQQLMNVPVDFEEVKLKDSDGKVIDSEKILSSPLSEANKMFDFNLPNQVTPSYSDVKIEDEFTSTPDFEQLKKGPKTIKVKSDYGDLELDMINGDSLNEDEIREFGFNPENFAVTSTLKDASDKPMVQDEESERDDEIQRLTQEEKDKAISDYKSQILEIQSKIDKAVQSNQNSVVRKLKRDLNKLDKFINEIEKPSSDIERDKVLKESKKAGSSNLCYDPKASNWFKPGPCVYGKSDSETDYALHPSNYKVVDALSLDRVSKLFPERDAKSTAAAIRRLFINPNTLEEEYQKAKKLNEEIYADSPYGGSFFDSKEDFARRYVESIMSDFQFTDQEVAKLDKYLQGVVNYKNTLTKKTKDGFNESEFFVVKLPNGYLPKMNIDVNGKSFSVFEGIQEDDSQRKRNVSHFGSSSWRKDSKSYKETSLRPNAESLPVPEFVVNELYKTKKGFSRQTLNLQRQMALEKDENGNPFLISNKGFYGKGLTGVRDKETIEAETKFRRHNQNKLKELMDKGFVKQGFDYDIAGQTLENNEINKLSKTGKTNAYYGKWALKNIPLSTFDSYQKAEAWASKSLPDNRKVVSIPTDAIDNMNSSEFIDYINSLGLPVKVVKNNNIFDRNSVTIYSDGGKTAKPFYVDLGEGKEQSYDLAVGLDKWLNAVQVSPREKFLTDWSAVYSPDVFVSSQSKVIAALGTQASISFIDRDGKRRLVSQDFDYKESRGIVESLKVPIAAVKALGTASDDRKKDDFTDQLVGLIEDQNKFLTEQQKQLDARIVKNQGIVNPIVQAFESDISSIKDKKKNLQNQLNTLQDKLSKNEISKEEFDGTSKKIYDELTVTSQKLSSSLNKYQQEIKKIEGETKQIQKDSEQMEDLIFQAQVSSNDISEAVAARYAILNSDYKGPGTFLGDLYAMGVKGFNSATQAALSASLDVVSMFGGDELLFGPGLSQEEYNARRSNFKADFIYDELGDLLARSYGAEMSDKYQEEMPEYTKMVGGAVQSIASAFNPVSRALGGIPGVGKYLQYAPLAYANIESQIESNPELASLPDIQKKAIAIPYAIAMSSIDSWGYEKLLKGDPSVTNKVLKSVVSSALKKVPNNATLKTIEAAIKGDLKSFGIRTLSALNRAGMSEGEAELLSASLGDIGILEFADLLLDKDAFNTDYAFKDYVKLGFESFAAGYVGGQFISVFPRMSEYIKTGNINLINQDDYKMFALLSNDDALKKMYTQSVANEFIARKITEEQAEAKILEFEEMAKIAKSIHPDLDIEEQKNVFVLINQKKEIENRMKDADESVKKMYTNNIKKIDESINSIISVAEERISEQQKAQEQNDKENEQGIPSEVGEGQESVQAEPVVEAGQEEVSPSGVVQEEQTQVTEEPGIEFAGIPIKEEGEPTTERTEITEPVDLFAQPTEETNIEEVEAAPSTPVQAVSDVADIKKVRGVKAKQEKITDYNAKYGEGQYERMSEIYANFTPIVKALEKNNLIKKDC